MDDFDIHLPGIVAGEPEAFTRWLAGAERPLRQSLRSFAARLDTEALLQETLLRVWQVAPRVVADGGGNSLLRLGLAIARNLARSGLRRARTDPVAIEVLERETTDTALLEPALPDPLLRALIEDCARRLPRQPALALQLRLGAAGSEPDESLARRADMKLNTFLQNFGRARRLLAACLSDRGLPVGSW